MKRRFLTLGLSILATLLFSSMFSSTTQALTIGGLTSEWVAVSYPGTNPDPFTDQQTGHAEADIVGSSSVPAIYTQFDDNGTVGDNSDDVIAFRFRMAQEGTPTGYSTAAIVGINAFPDSLNPNDPMDLSLILNTSPSGDTLQLYDPGSKANISPNTTNTSKIAGTDFDTNELGLPLNYDWSPLSASNCDGPCAADADFDLDGDGTETDHFLSFSYSFQLIIDELNNNLIPGVDENSAFSYVFGTSTQVNAFNQDLGGVDDGVADMSLSWAELGVLSSPYTASGVLVPEPDSWLLVASSLAFLALRGRRRHTHRGPAPSAALRDPGPVAPE